MREIIEKFQALFEEATNCLKIDKSKLPTFKVECEAIDKENIKYFLSYTKGKNKVEIVYSKNLTPEKFKEILEKEPYIVEHPFLSVAFSLLFPIKDKKLRDYIAGYASLLYIAWKYMDNKDAREFVNGVKTIYELHPYSIFSTDKIEEVIRPLKRGIDIILEIGERREYSEELRKKLGEGICIDIIFSLMEFVHTQYLSLKK